jgi:beta-galactosidase/beta-glucuronidase
MPLTALSSNDLDSHGRGYPRPQLRRDTWYSLNGTWEFALDPDGIWRVPDDVDWSDRITVPFAPEAPSSGVNHTGFFRACWYRHRCELPPRQQGERWILHFGAVDWSATVWINGVYAGRHEGGYTPFSFDLTDLVSTSTCEIVLRADDDPHDLAKPRGKQDWQLEPHSIWYPRTSGIWQTVWLEKVPATRIGHLAFTPNLARWEIGVEMRLDGSRRADLRLAIRLHSGA